MNRSTQMLGVGILILIVLTGTVYVAVYAEDRRGLLTVSFLDVGQGDAVFIDAPNGMQMLVDGGPDASVLRQLATVMPWYDKSIDVVVATHPDADHIAGLVDVFDRYSVSTIVVSSVDGTTDLAGVFAEKVANEGARVIVGERGDVVDLGGGVALEILFPDRSVDHVATNVGCIVARLTYGSTAFMLPCDTTAEVETYLARIDGERLKSNVLKAAHHGSKTSSAPMFVGFTAPEYAVYSRGCGNSYGHPHAQVVATYTAFDIPTLDTCEAGTITFVSDGQAVTRK